MVDSHTFLQPRRQSPDNMLHLSEGQNDSCTVKLEAASASKTLLVGITLTKFPNDCNHHNHHHGFPTSNKYT